MTAEFEKKWKRNDDKNQWELVSRVGRVCAWVADEAVMDSRKYEGVAEQAKEHVEKKACRRCRYNFKNPFGRDGCTDRVMRR